MTFLQEILVGVLFYILCGAITYVFICRRKNSLLMSFAWTWILIHVLSGKSYEDARKALIWN